jgi:hypothetical protein
MASTNQEDLHYGGFTRFELELEASSFDATKYDRLLTSFPVCPAAWQSILSKSAG